jgi:Multidrug resistance efflux pump
LLWSIFKPKEAAYKTEVAVIGSITQEVTETGSVRKGEAINLNFKNSGIIEKISVSRGEEVSAGQVLAELDNRQAQIQMTQAKASYEATLFQLEKLKRGAGGEDVAIVESQVLAARAALDAARRAQEDARAVPIRG